MRNVPVVLSDYVFPNRGYNSFFYKNRSEIVRQRYLDYLINMYFSTKALSIILTGTMRCSLCFILATEAASLYIKIY